MAEQKEYKELSYPEAVTKGREIWKELQIALKDHSRQDKNMDAQYKNHYRPEPSTPNASTYESNGVQWLLYDKLGLPRSDKQWQEMDLYLPGTEIIVFDNIFGPGFILASQNYTNRDKREGTGIKIPWSEAGFVGYKNYKGDAGVKDLRFIVRFSINKEAEKIIAQARVNLNKTEKDMIVVHQGVQEEQEVFYALLGSHNGRGAAFILKDHCNALDRRNIKSIIVPATTAVPEAQQRGLAYMIVIEYE